MSRLLALLALLSPTVVSAQLTYTIGDPLAERGISSAGDLITVILNILLIIAVPIIVFFIIFAGFSYVTARGNPEKIQQASRSLTYAIIGGILILGAVALTEIISGVVCSFSSDPAACNQV